MHARDKFQVNVVFFFAQREKNTTSTIHPRDFQSAVIKNHETL